MAIEFIATNGVVIRPSGDGTLVENVYLGDRHLDALLQYATYLETEFQDEHPHPSPA